MKILIGLLLCIPLLVFAGLRTYCQITFGIDCGGHMERAGSANSIELAQQEMETVVKYADVNHMTSGYTSIIYNTPSEDVGFWYNNMKASLDELRRVKPTTAELEKSNMLIKLRESLLHHTKEGTHITVPDGISRFPHNTAFCFFGSISCLMALVGVILIRVQLDD